jgi:hypothetical protein
MQNGETIRTHVSRGTQEIGLNLIGKMARQLHVTGSEFSAMVGCTMSCAEYLAKFRDDGN